MGVLADALVGSFTVFENGLAFYVHIDGDSGKLSLSTGFSSSRRRTVYSCRWERPAEVGTRGAEPADASPAPGRALCRHSAGIGDAIDHMLCVGSIQISCGSNDGCTLAQIAPRIDCVLQVSAAFTRAAVVGDVIRGHQIPGVARWNHDCIRMLQQCIVDRRHPAQDGRRWVHRV